MIKSLFTQDLTRDIETVVKADDKRNQDVEIKEYVITKEISRKIGDLFSEYGRSTTINGVWIHGFFGSGKSHLLKMLSFVFGGVKMEDGRSAAEVFATKTNDELLKSDILRVANMPAESILFNIDQQATISSKERDSAVLSVFYKVFFDHLGFYGTQPHIAEFEWWLQFRRNIYQEFKEKFAEITGKDWQDARRDYYDIDVTDGISSALGQLLDKEESEYETILETIEDRQNLSVEDFAQRVNEYIKSKPKDFQLNFFIDEVGQFIAGDVSLMLNLQSITESLATHTKNKSWVFATAQSAIEGLGDDIKNTQDYSKILGRFRMQINLTSANVDEVIEKRLLEKKEEAKPGLKEMYQDKKSLLDAMISTTDKGMLITAYQDENDFIDKYPFLHYQFSLFQQCRTTLADRGAFQGKHAAVGERSMLGVFQNVLKHIQNDKLMTLPSFDLMYSGIENDLRAEFVNTINDAHANLRDAFALKVLKVLFLVKYYPTFVATKENIGILLIDHIDVDLKAHQEKVNTALARLENATFVERNGEVYEFLTNKEKDVESEIKNTAIEESKINNLLKELFYDQVLGRFSTRIRYDDNKQDYEFTPKLDGGTFGREKELAIEIISPNYDGIEDLENLKGQTMGLPLLRLVTEPDSEFMEDVRMVLKIERFNSLNQTTANNDEIRSILFQKLSDNTRRKKSLAERANTMLGRAKAFVSGSQLDVTPKSSGQTYVIECFQHLIRVMYPNLRFLGSIAYSQDTIKDIMRKTNVPGLFDTGDASVSEAEAQILNVIKRRKNQSERTALQDLKNHFAKRPFGWYENATFSLLAKLYKKNKVEVAIGEKLLNDAEMIDALLNSSQHSRTFVNIQTEFSSRQIKDIKELYRDLFDRTSVFNDAKDIGIDFRERLTEMVHDVQSILAQRDSFPFVERLRSFYEELKEWSVKNYTEIIEKARDMEDALLDIKEEDYDKIKEFLYGSQKQVYKNIAEIVRNENANLNHIDGDEYESLKRFLHEERPYIGNALQKAEAQRKQLADKLIKRIKEEKELTRQVFEENLNHLENHEVMLQLQEDDFARLIHDFKKRGEGIENQRFIGNLQAERSHLSTLINDILNKAVEINVRNSHTEKPMEGGSEKIISYVSHDAVNIPFDKDELTNEEEVREYVKLLEEVFIKQIKNNKRIRL